MNKKQYKKVKKLYNSALDDCCYLKALLLALHDNGEAEYPKNFLYNIAQKDQKNVGKNIITCMELLSK